AEPSSARPANNWVFGIFGGVLALVGALLIYLAFTRYPVTRMTGLMAVAMFCYSGMKVQNFLLRKGQRMSLVNWRAAMKQKHETDMQALPVARVEDLIRSDDGVRKMQAQQEKAAKVVGPLLLVVGAALLWLGVHAGNKLENTLQYG